MLHTFTLLPRSKWTPIFLFFFLFFLFGDWTNHRMAHVQGIGRGRGKNRPGMFSLTSLIVAKKKSVLLILTSGTVYCIHSNRHTSPSLLNQQSVTRSKNKCFFFKKERKLHSRQSDGRENSFFLFFFPFSSVRFHAVDTFCKPSRELNEAAADGRLGRNVTPRIYCM